MLSIVNKLPFGEWAEFRLDAGGFGGGVVICPFWVPSCGWGGTPPLIGSTNAPGDRLLVVKLRGSSVTVVVIVVVAVQPRISAIRWGVGVLGGFAYTWGCQVLRGVSLTPTTWLLLFILFKKWLRWWSSPWFISTVDSIARMFTSQHFTNGHHSFRDGRLPTTVYWLLTPRCFTQRPPGALLLHIVIPLAMLVDRV